jgi:type II secretory pathway component PulF
VIGLVLFVVPLVPAALEVSARDGALGPAYLARVLPVLLLSIGVLALAALAFILAPEAVWDALPIVGSLVRMRRHARAASLGALSLRAGLSIQQVIGAMGQASASGASAGRAQATLSAIDGGATFHAAVMSSRLLPAECGADLQAAEASGTLETTLERLSSAWNEALAARIATLSKVGAALLAVLMAGAAAYSVFSFLSGQMGGVIKELDSAR